MNPALFFAGAFAVAVAAVFFARFENRKKMRKLLKLKLILVRFPRAAAENKKIEEEIGLSEQFLSGLAGIKEPVIFEVAVPYVGEEIHFYAATNDKYMAPLVRHIQSIWPDAQVEAAEDYNIFNYSGEVSAACVTQKNKFIFPVRTYREFGTDTFSPIIGGLSKINEIGEGGAIQYVIVPAAKKEKKRISSALKTLKKDGSIDFRAKGLNISVSDFKRAVTVGTAAKEKNVIDKERRIEESAVKAIESKISKPLFRVNIRIVASAPTREVADSIVSGVAVGFSQFGAQELNEFRVTPPRLAREFTHQFSFRAFSEKEVNILNAEELASVFHFPTPFTATPKIKEARNKEVAPPNLPKDGIKIGENRYRGTVRDVCISREDRRQHLYIVGQTGTGKSVFMNNVVKQDMEMGEGVCVIDPNGDLFEDIIARIPPGREKDAIIFDPADMQYPFGLNVLEYNPAFPEQKTFIINELLGIFDTLYDLKTTGGPMFEQYTRNALLLLMDNPQDGYTILEIPRVLSDSKFRSYLMSKCSNAITKDFWEKEAEKAGGEAALANLVPYITSKFNTFIANDYMRPIIAQSRSTLRFREIMDEGKILLVNLSKGRLGELSSALLGMLVIVKLTMAAFSRADIPLEKRKDFYLYVDEFQNFTTPSIQTILSESRKYRLCLTVAHQFIAQLPDKIRNAVFGNVGSMVAFRVGADDAEYLGKHFEPEFSKSDLMNVDNLNAHAKLLINGQTSRPFNISILLPGAGFARDTEKIRNISRNTFGVPRETAEREIYTRLKTAR
ncbi:hypothetical protein A3I34_01035 [Candidatus Jorgensenbacteria bacterium RIFCSPLOWO2_02_FULL_45_12]|uniref:Type IV secretion system coupling protein TraD DNA-binding domain-containing protein n=1 Tax=Candidatus Jorgensenbacteria bacterium RIFCSPHIGHO2_02_FULL_45_20 TaxID=1798470 RepID=A0A1F6BMP2_9BACT|nr:MAG: hypothetical protein A3D55_00495 [Candidatus Jorgensenbacteria bacterium RIFCSPHIGHO2_02_FULL_45_20]OGG42238.1 MAG: hypothetical protein A3I34_01035 [Candidatus Jorgensenbacteria bacterium RIFCSPLOWO2_02_FULL_45_12]